ncbi:hypothetical protein Bca52824_014846 [Brassica carinata]|uniref:Uncharacterized protein n=1 Tax=Brassica carinata TaxID=52824 RepID=A0A8X7W0J0_BRACI|nr:hypothetical protein Bca52824_014846 [Brassica carinata]
MIDKEHRKLRFMPLLSKLNPLSPQMWSSVTLIHRFMLTYINLSKYYCEEICATEHSDEGMKLGFEHDNFEVYRFNGVETVTKLSDNVRISNDRGHKQGVGCTEAGAKNNTEASLVVKFLLMESINKLRTVAGLIVFRARLGVFNSNGVKNEDGSFFTFSERYLQPVKSLAEHVPVTLQASSSKGLRKNFSSSSYVN